MAKVTIDNIEIEVPDGTTILQAARMIGERNKADRHVVPPTMCYYSKLKTSGGYCRTCIVKVTKGSEKDPRPMPKPVASCRTAVMDGMVVENTINADLIESRKSVTEFLLINHPLDCPICDQAGECHLQDLSYENGKEASRYDFERRKQLVAEGGFSRAAFNELAELGLGGLYIPEELGGLGMGPVEGMVVMEELGRGIVLEPLAHTLIAGAVLSHYATTALQTEWCAKVAGGEALVVLAHQERKARYNPKVCETQAKAAGDVWTITGAKSVVAAGDHADAWLVPLLR
jgi:ferredoxin